jgi:hypothetical protein
MKLQNGGGEYLGRLWRTVECTLRRFGSALTLGAIVGINEGEIAIGILLL